MNFLNRFSYKVQQFLQGRCGMDRLNKVLLVAAVILEFIYLITQAIWISWITFIPLGICLFRMLSRNIEMRRKENQKFLKLVRAVKLRLCYHIYKCPTCGQKIRIPRKMWKRVEISCPKCRSKFIKRI